MYPAGEERKQAFFSLVPGMYAQEDGEYAEALENYYEALQLEEDPYDRNLILYNIGLIYAINGEDIQALEYYHQAIEFDFNDLDSNLIQTLNNIGRTYASLSIKAAKRGDTEISNDLFEIEKVALDWRDRIKEIF